MARSTVGTSRPPASAGWTRGRVARRERCGRATASCSPKPIGDHGITILLARGELDLEADLASDSRSVWPLVESLLDAAAPGLRWMRDPTRGGVATALNELARDSGLGVMLWEEDVPVREPVRGACELLGLDPLHIANEGQFLAVVGPEHADAALASPARHGRGRGGGDHRRAAPGALPHRARRHLLRQQPSGRHATVSDPLLQDLPDGESIKRATRSRAPCRSPPATRGPAGSRSGCWRATPPRPPSSPPRACAWRRPARRWPHASCAAAGRCSAAAGHALDRCRARLRRVRAPGDRRQAGSPGARRVALLPRAIGGDAAAGRHGHGFRAAGGRSRDRRGACLGGGARRPDLRPGRRAVGQRAATPAWGGICVRRGFGRPLHSPGTGGDPLPHPVGDRARRLLRASRARSRRGCSGIPLSLPGAGEAGHRRRAGQRSQP